MQTDAARAMIDEPTGDSAPAPCQLCMARTQSVCAALGAADLERFADAVQPQQFPPRHILFAEGEPAVSFFNVTAGTVKLYKLLPDGRRQVTGFLFSGDVLGLSVRDRYAYSAEAVTATTVCRVPRWRLENLLDELPQLQRSLFSRASHELAAAQDQMLLLGRKTAREKIASFLLFLSQQAARRGFRDNPVHVAMSRSDIADYLGLTTETVSRTFTQLKADGSIRLGDAGRVHLTDLETLQAIADAG